MDPRPGLARHAAVARSSPRQLAWRWLRTFRWHLVVLFLSDFGQDLIRRKYDAFTTDRAYENRPSGRLLVGKVIDWIVLRQTLHEGLRQRLMIVVGELVRLTRHFQEQGFAPVRIGSGPSGLARDLLLAARVLRDSGPLAGRVEFWAIDLDFSGDVLAEAARRAQEARVELFTMKQDLLSAGRLQEAFREKPPNVFNCIGLTAWLDRDQVVELFHAAQSVLAPQGALVVDNFRVYPQSRFGPDLEIDTRYHPDTAFEEDLHSAGFETERKQETPNHVNVVYTARKPR